jgi:hypothetical protein
MTNPAILPATKIKNKNPVKIYADYKDASLYVAQRIAGLIKAKESKGEKNNFGVGNRVFAQTSISGVGSVSQKRRIEL